MGSGRSILPFRVSPSFLLLAMLAFTTACSSSDCSCDGFEPKPFPEEHYDKTVPLSGQARVSQSGLEFLEGEIPALIEQFQPGGLSFCLPSDTSSNPSLCENSTCADGSPGCQLDLTIDDAQFVAEPTDTLNVDVTIGGIGGRENGQPVDTVDFVYDTLWDVDCEIRLYDQSGDKDDPAEIQATIPITFNIDQNSPTKDLKIDIGDIQMDDFTDQVQYDLEGGFDCSVGGWLSSLFNGTINGMIKDELGNAIGGIERSQLCQVCGDQEPACPQNSTCTDVEGDMVCMYDQQADQCVPRMLGVEGDLSLGALLGDYSQNPEAVTHVSLRAADHAVVDTGLSIGLRSGFQPSQSGRCIPIDPTARPSFDAIAPSPSILTDTRPDTGEPFMIGLGFHERAIEHMLWSAWGSGALCLKLGSDSIDMLTTQSLGAILPSLKELAGRKASVFIQLAPQTAPQVTLGSNQVTPDGDTYTIDDPLMMLDWIDVDIHFYVFAQDRFTRVFTLRTDLHVPIALAADGQGSIIPVLGDMENAVQNVRPIKSELLAEDPQTLIDLLPTLLNLALPSLAGSISQPIELPELMGYVIALDQGDITSVDNNTMIALYADLVPAASAYALPLSTQILDTQVDTSPVTASGVPRPVATVDVLAELPGYASQAADDVEFSWRVNGGVWSLYHRASQLRIQDPTLVLQGTHRIEVRSRFVGDTLSTEAQPAVAMVRVDYEAPELRIERDGASVELVADDAVDQPHQMSYRYRIVDGESPSQWTAWSHRPTIDLGAIDAPERFRLVAQARDRQGHVSEDEQNVRWQPLEPDEPTTPTGIDEPQGCAQSGQSTPAGGALLAVALAFGLWLSRRRQGLRRALAAIAVVGLAGLGTGCSDDASGASTNNQTPAQCSPACGMGEECVEGQCVPASCTEASECTCPAGRIATCTDGVCACEAPCADGCGDAEFCCQQTNSCQPMPDACADQVCDPGYEPEVQSAGTPNPETCEVEGAACTCVKMPPLDPGQFGQYGAIDSNGTVTAVSVYSKTYGDLMVGIVQGERQADWTYVDGVPDSGDIEGDPDGPRGGIADAGPNVGTHTAIAVDDAGTLHVFYRDEDNGTVKYARGTDSGGSYTFEVAEFDADDAGYYPDAIVADGAVHVAYGVYEAETADGSWQTQLRHLSFPVDTALGDLAAEPNIVHGVAAAVPCGASCASGELCFTADDACAAYTDDCAEDCADGLACRGGTCEEFYLPAQDQFPVMTGLFAELSQTADGLLVTFYNHMDKRVGWAQRTAEGWQDAQFLNVDSGPYASGQVDANGKLHLAYMDPADQALSYTIPGELGPEVIMSGVRDSAVAYVLADIGEDVHLRTRDDGTVEVVFQDATWHRLHRATRQGADSWALETVAEPGDPYTGAHGFYSDIVTTGADDQASIELVIDSQADPASWRPEFPPLP